MHKMENTELLFAGVTRKSPTKKGIEESRKIQEDGILNKISQDFNLKREQIKIDWFFDVSEGDNPNRLNLLQLFSSLDKYSYVYVYNADRWSRSFLGTLWFETYFKNPKNPMLRFANEVPDLYYKDPITNEYLIHSKTGERMINDASYLMFSLWLTFAQAELYKIRNRTHLGREKILKNPELRKEKYRGRKPGSKNKPKTEDLD